MSGLFSKFKGGSGGPTSPSSPSSSRYGKNQEPEPDLTPLQRMLQNAGPVRSDGSDKFFGLENFGNTCYCNSIVQALYYSVPFRENVVNYPPHSPYDTPNGFPKIDVPIRAPIQNGGAGSPGKTKGISAQEAMKRRAAINAGQPGSPQIGQRPEDKPDSPEYKKKHAMLTGPVLELTYESASSYGMEESTFTALKDIFMALIANPSRSGVLSPQRFLEIFKRDNEMFRTSMHQDAHEFYGLVLNAVITNVEENSIRLKELGPPKIENGLVPSMKAAVTSAAHAMGLTAGARSPGTGWVHDIFEGVLTSETKCLTCETASQRDETFLDLSIDLEEHSSVTSCLRKFSAEEMLCERNKFHCDNCGGLQEAEKRMKIKKLPKILTLHLKRFKYTEDMTRLQKLFHRVVYPYHLRMFNTTDDTTDPDRLYELYAVVIHIGGNAYHGHYVSVIKTQDRGWLLFDDEMVEPVDKNYVRNFFGDKPGQACAYVLFYQETTVEAMKKEQEAEGLAEVTLASQEAGVALGHPQPNGTYPAAFSKAVPIPDTPLEQTEEFVSLNHAVSAPMPLTHTTSPRPVAASYGNSSYIPPADGTKEKSKEEKAKIQKDTKESEKARKAAEKQKLKEAEQKRKDAEAAEKQRVKEAEQKRKDADTARREEARKAAEENRKTIALSKQTAAEEEEKRKKAAAAVAPISIPNRSSTFGPSGLGNENGNHEDRPSGTSLSRSHKYSKSMSRKSFGSFFGKHAEKNGDKLPSATNGDKNGDSIRQGDDHTALEGDTGPQTPEKHSKPAKDRFSFSGLGRKKSSLIS